MEYGRFLLLPRVGGAGAWFGLDHNQWATWRDTPLWLYLYGDGHWLWQSVKLKPLSEIRDTLSQPGQDPPEFIDGGDHLLVPIYLPVGVSEDAVLKDVVERIGEIGRRVNPA